MKPSLSKFFLFKYFIFSGRARRSEFWSFALVNLLLAAVVWFFLLFYFAYWSNFLLSPFLVLFLVSFILPPWIAYMLSIAMVVRRLHDIGKSGWWFLLGFVPIVGWLIMLNWLCWDSQPVDNKWGENPKSGCRTLTKQSYKKCFLLSYFNFSGRARRCEYVCIYLCNLYLSCPVVSAAVCFILLYFAKHYDLDYDYYEAYIPMLFLLWGCLYIPYVAYIFSIPVLVRRLHDLGLSGWASLLGFFPIIDFFLYSTPKEFFPVMLVCWYPVSLLLGFFPCFFPSQRGENKWGENPKGE